MAENQNLEKQLSELAEFLVKARQETLNISKSYDERLRQIRLEYQNGQFYYLNSCDGLFQIFDREEVRSTKYGRKRFALTLFGALDTEFHEDKPENRELALKNLAFFRTARSKLPVELYTKPNKIKEKIHYSEPSWVCFNEIEGDIKFLNGEGDTHHKDKHIFKYEFSGGIII